MPPCWNGLCLGPFSSKIGVRDSSSMVRHTVPVTVPSARKEKRGRPSFLSYTFTRDVRITAVP